MHAARPGQVLVGRQRSRPSRPDPWPRRRRQSRFESVSSGPNTRNVDRVAPDHVAEELARARASPPTVGRPGPPPTRPPRSRGSRAASRSRSSSPPFACGLALIRRVRPRAPGRRSRRAAARARRTARRAGSCASTRSSSARCASSCRAFEIGTWCERHVPSTGLPSTSFGPVQPFGDAEHDHRPRRPVEVGRPSARGPGAWIAADLRDRPSSSVCGHRADASAAGRRRSTSYDVIAAALDEGAQLRVRDAREDRRVGDLVAVEVEDRQDRAVVDRVEELVRLPARGQRAGLGLAVADDAAHDQIRVVERGAVARGSARSRARRPRGSSPGVSGATWLGMPPGNENWRNSARRPSSLRRIAG